MKYFVKIITISLMITISAVFFLTTPSYAQLFGTYPGSFGVTSLSNLGISSPLGYTYPGSFGTTSLTGYGTYPYYSGYTSSLYPYYGNTMVGGYPGLAGLSPYSGIGVGSGYTNIMQALQYYQYLTYAYNFYMIARSTPMFYQNDILADYIGSSLYSYAQNLNLSPQEAIITFIRQNLL